MERADYARALPLLEELADLTPGDQRFPQRLLECQQRLGLAKEARETLARMKPADRPEAMAVTRTPGGADDVVLRGVENRRQRRRARRLYRATLGRGDPATFDPRDLSGDTLAIVTGLPRSGTSLMMQMLRKGGMSICYDLGFADDDNPGGYLECRRLQRFFFEPVLLEGVGSSALKLFADVLEYLPVSHRYDIVLMMRPLEEVFASQEAFIGRHPNFRSRFASPHMSASAQRETRDRILARLPKWPQVNLLTVDYPSLVADPWRATAQLAAFLGKARIAHPDRMAALVEAARYRNRTDERSPASSNA
jgi:hypothetical protein